MTLDDACRSVLGRAAADAIIADRGLHWAAVAAIAAAKNFHDPYAIAALSAHLKSVKEGRAILAESAALEGK